MPTDQELRDTCSRKPKGNNTIATGNHCGIALLISSVGVLIPGGFALLEPWQQIAAPILAVTGFLAVAVSTVRELA